MYPSKKTKKKKKKKQCNLFVSKLGLYTDVCLNFPWPDDTIVRLLPISFYQ